MDMKTAERVVMVLLLLVILGGSTWIYFTVIAEQTALRDAVARGEYQIPDPPAETEVATTDQENWRQYYPVTQPVVIGSTTVAASVADTLPERIKGLSDTPYLPEGVVKLFVFGANGPHSIWMKDMEYSLDIIWVEKSGAIVHIEENVAPETYPAQSFSSPVPAWYVIEANAGFVAKNDITIGTIVKTIDRTAP